MATKSIVGANGQIMLPKAIREKYHFLEGEEVVLVLQKDGVLVKHTSATLRGKFRGKLDLKGFEQDIQTTSQGVEVHRSMKLSVVGALDSLVCWCPLQVRLIPNC